MCNSLMDLCSMDQEPSKTTARYKKYKKKYEKRMDAGLIFGDCFFECRKCGKIEELTEEPRCVVLRHNYSR